MSFCTVPEIFFMSAPWLRAMATYMLRSIAAVAFIVMDVVTPSRGISRKRTCMSASVSIATPTFPTSPWAR